MVWREKNVFLVSLFVQMRDMTGENFDKIWCLFLSSGDIFYSAVSVEWSLKNFFQKIFYFFLFLFFSLLPFFLYFSDKELEGQLSVDGPLKKSLVWQVIISSQVQ